MEKALILHSHASASELVHFQYNSFRKALILNSHASALELIQLQCSSCRKELILDSHASQPLNWSSLNASRKEKHCFWTVTPRATTSLSLSHASQSLNWLRFNVRLKEKNGFWTVTSQAQHWWILNRIWQKNLNSRQSRVKIRTHSFLVKCLVF